jgi:tripartite-type tricarboxylate transporter receptor subunit TctC
MQKKNMGRRSFLAQGAAAIALGTASMGAVAAAYPDKPVRVVIQYPVGGPVDQIARLILGRVQQKHGYVFVIDAKPGAGGTIATAEVARAPADGYTLLVSASGPLAMAPWLQKVSYDPVKSFKPVVHFASVPLVLLVNSSVNAKNVQEFISILKPNPGKYSFGSSGNGTPQHLSAELFKAMAGVDALHVPYRGQAPMAVDLIGGQVSFAVDSLVTVMPHIQSGKLKPLAVTSQKRNALLPEVPTLDESGLAGYESIAWYGLVAPANTPDAIVDQLNAEISAVMREPEIQAQLAKMGTPYVAGPRANFGRFIDAEYGKWGKVIKDNKITLD